METMLTAVVVLLAAFFATVSGFGFALVATPLLTLFMDAKEAVVLVLLAGFVLRAITMIRNRRNFEWHTVLLVTFGSMLGIVPGSVALKVISIEQLEIFLGVILLAATFLMGRKINFKIINKTLGRLAAGFLSGFFGSATSVSGPPLVLYFLNENMEKDLMRANMIWCFGLNGTLMLIGSYLAGTMQYVSVEQGSVLYSMTALLLGWWMGEKLFYKLNQHLFRRLSLIIVCGGALGMLYSGIKAVLM